MVHVQSNTGHVHADRYIQPWTLHRLCLNIPADPPLEVGKLGLLESTKQLILKKKKSIWKAISLAFFMWTNLENAMMFGTSGSSTMA